MVKILHISDLHFVKDAANSDMWEVLKNEAREAVAGLPQGFKLLIVTGDFHNYNTAGYDDAVKFLNELIAAMDLDRTQDVFVVPGNHDIGNKDDMSKCFPGDEDWSMRMEMAVTKLRSSWPSDQADAKRTMPENYLRWRMESYRPYCEFIKTLGIYPAAQLKDDPYLPARTHIRCWRGRLNLLHLNTTLVAAGGGERNELTDVNTAASPETWKDFNLELPCLALGHNSFFDLDATQQDLLRTPFAQKNVSAYLCGDTHRKERNMNKQWVQLDSGDPAKAIPNVVCAKGVADLTDPYSDFGFYWHDWNEADNQVELRFRRWCVSNGAETEPDGKPIPYRMRRRAKATPVLKNTAPLPPERPGAVELDEASELSEYLDSLIQSNRAAHPSFKLMAMSDFDRNLLPGIAKLERFVPHGTINEAREANPVWQLIQSTWKEAENHSIVIQGDGGIGKTVTLLSFTEDKGEQKWPPAIYVPLYDLAEGDGKCLSISDYLRQRLPERAEAILKLAGKPWENGPSLLLLLDGINEIPSGSRDVVLGSLNQWHLDHNGAQLILVTRPLDFINFSYVLDGKLAEIRLCPLDRSDVKAYLERNGFKVPNESSSVWDVLVLPLFLTLYVKADRLKETAACGYPLRPKETAGPGAIIWNYLQRELLQKKSEKWVIRCAVACEYLLPAIAWEMARKQDFELSKEQIMVIADNELSKFNFDSLPLHLCELFDLYDDKHKGTPDLAKINWTDVLLDESGILSPARSTSKKKEKRSKDKRFEFIHQNFRDCLAAIHLINQAEKAGDVLPATWAEHQDSNVLDYVAELTDLEAFQSVWEANRKTKPTNYVATATLLELARRKKYDRNEALPDMDFSGMNLRAFSLTRYLRQEINLGLFRKPELSEKTELDFASFRSPGHFWSVNCLLLTSSGLVVSASDDDTLRVWDPATGECLRTLEGHRGSVNCVIETKGGQLVSGSGDNTLRVWDPATGECLRTLKGHSSRVTCVIETKGGQLVSGSSDNTLRVWDPETGECLRTLEGHRKVVYCVIETKGGQLVSGSLDNTLRVWDPATDECLRTLEGHKGKVYCVIETKGGQLVSGSLDNTLRVWDPATGECLRTLEGHKWPVTCVIETKGAQLVSGSYDHTLRVWDPETGECLRTLEGHGGAVQCVIETKGGQLVSGSSDNTLRVWDPATGECLRTLEGHRKVVYCVIETKGGQLVSGSLDNTLRVWDPATGQCLRTLKEHTNSVSCVMETKGGQLVSGSNDGTLRVCDPATGACLCTLEGHEKTLLGGITCIMETKGGQLVSGSWDNTLRVWDPATGECLRTLEGHEKMLLGGITCVMETKGGQLVSGSWDNTLRVWDPATGECLRRLVGHEKTLLGGITCVMETKGGQLVSGSEDRTLRVWDPATGECLRTLKGHNDPVICVMETKGGQLVSGSSDNTLRVWDPETGECLRTLGGHGGAVQCVIETKGGQLVSGSSDNTLRVWDPATGECLRTLEGHRKAVYCVIETKGGQLVSGSLDNTLRVWDPATGQCLRTLKEHTNSVSCVMETKGGQLVSGLDDNTLRVWDLSKGMGRECVEVLYPIEAGVSVRGLDFSRASFPEDPAAALPTMLWQNGAAIPGKRSWTKSEPSTE